MDKGKGKAGSKKLRQTQLDGVTGYMKAYLTGDQRCSI